MFKGFKIFSLVGLAFTCNACTGVDYVSNSGYAEFSGEKINREADFDTSRGAKQYGALLFKRDSSKAISDKGNAFAVTLKRQKDNFFGEATLFDSKNTEKTFIDKTFFDLGVNRRTKGINLGMTFKF